jgi:6-phosphogluconolactonase
MKRTFVYVGTYTQPIRFGTGEILQGKGEGIYLLELNSATGELNLRKTVYGVENPSYLVLNKKNRCLYAVNELKMFNGNPSGSVSAFQVSDDGTLTFLNKQATKGTDPCYLEVSPDGTHLYVCNFMSGSVIVYPILDNGAIGEAVQFIQHEGRSVHPRRQTGPHAHSLLFSPDQKYVLVPDLGLDKVIIYPFAQETGLLHETPAFAFSVRPGGGPRHGVFSEDGRYFYLLNEIDATIVVIQFQEGVPRECQVVSALPEGVDGSNNLCADIHLTPDGTYLYVSNRGDDSLVCYRVQPKSGLLSYAGYQSCGGKTPRSFGIDPSGRYLICANQDSDNIVVFTIDYQTGGLKAAAEIAIPTPVCVKFDLR